jgi:PST family polysaccharide transporter
VDVTPPDPAAERVAAAAHGSLGRTVMRGIGLAGTGYVLSQMLTIVSYLALARLVTPTDFGQFAAGSLLLGLGALLAEGGMLAALIQRRDRLEEAASTAFFATVAAGFMFGGLALALSPLIGLFFGSREIALVAAAMSGWIVIRETAVVPNALLQRRFSFVRRLVSEPASAVAFGVTAIVLAAYGLGAWALVAGTYMAVVVQAAIPWALVHWRPEWSRASFQLWRELVAYGKHITAADVVRRVTSESGTIFVGRALGVAPLGQYQFAYRIAQRPFAALVNSVTFVLFPAFARIADDDARFRRAFLRSLRWLSAVAFPASFVLLPFGEPVVVLLFGEAWRDAGIALMGMCGYTVGWAYISLAEHVGKSVGRPDVVLRLDLAAGVSVVALMGALVAFGLLGAAIALSLSASAAAVYSFTWLVRLTGIPLRRLLRETWPPAAAAASMAGALLVLDRLVVQAGERAPVTGLALVALMVVAGATLYFTVLAALAPHLARELGVTLGARSGRR